MKINAKQLDHMCMPAVRMAPPSFILLYSIIQSNSLNTPVNQLEFI